MLQQLACAVFASFCVVLPDASQPGTIGRLKEEAKQRIVRDAQNAKQQAERAVAEMDEAAQKAWMESMMPGPAHEVLKAFEGTWDGQSEAFMAPGAPPAKSGGVMTTTWELGGRWLRQEWKGEMMGQPFEGVSSFGYDNNRKLYLGIWRDTFSTGMLQSEGTYDAAKKTFTMRGPMYRPGGVRVESKQVTVIESPDRHVFELFSIGPDGSEMRMMRITYTRRK